MAVRTVADWANAIVPPETSDIYKFPATSSTAPRKGSMIKMSVGVATEVVEGEDADFYGVTLSEPVLGLDGNYYSTVARKGQYVFAVDTGDTLTDYEEGYAVMIGDNCQTVKLATVLPTPGIDASVGRVAYVDTAATKDWRDVIYGIERSTQGDNDGTEIDYDIVVIEITPGI